MIYLYTYLFIGFAFFCWILSSSQVHGERAIIALFAIPFWPLMLLLAAIWELRPHKVNYCLVCGGDFDEHREHCMYVGQGNQNETYIRDWIGK